MSDTPDAPAADERDRAGAAGARRLRGALEWIVVVGGAVAVALLARAFLVQAFYIPSESMEPTLRENDRVLVNKLAYDVGEVDRGDIVVFERPEEDLGPADIKDLIKRVVAVEGDSLVIEGGVVSIDGVPVDEPYLAEGTVTADAQGVGDPTAGGVLHRCSTDDPCIVPEGYVFVMGDNRSNSRDSRFPEVGYIDVDTIVGEAFVRVWPPTRVGGI